MLRLILESFTQPRVTIREILRLRLDSRVLILAAILVAVVMSLAESLTRVMVPPEGPSLTGGMGGPIPAAVIQFGLLMLTAVLIERVGGMFGGRATWNQALTVAVWHGVVGLLPNIVQLVLHASGSPMAPMVMLVLLVWLTVIFIAFIQEVHGFENVWLTALGAFATSFIVGLVVLALLSMLGVMPQAQV